MTEPGEQRGVAGIVLAGGSGTRFGGPKQLAPFAGSTLLDRAVELLLATCETVVVAKNATLDWHRHDVVIVDGGASRPESTRNALAAVPADADVVVLHDSIRPFASRRTVHDLVAAIRAGADAALPVWQPPDTVKRLRPDGSLAHVGREELRVAAGPACYRASSLRDLFARVAEIEVEETIAIEQLGGRVVPVEADPWSHHVVTPRDLAIMDALLAQGFDGT